MMKVDKNIDLHGVDIRLEEDPFSLNAPWIFVVADSVGRDTFEMEMAIEKLGNLLLKMSDEIRAARKL